VSDTEPRANWQARDGSSGRVQLQRISDPETDENPVQVAYRRLIEHCEACPTCRTLDEPSSKNKNLDCPEGKQASQAYRDARRAAISA